MYRSLASALVVLGSIVGGAWECSVPPNTPLAQQGADVYRQMCSVCHGVTGDGYHADQATALAHPDFLASVGDKFLENAIRNGRSGSTMSAWAVQRGGPLQNADVDALVAFLRHWQTRPTATLDESPLRGDPAKGEKTYGENCASCHGAKGTGGPNVGIANPEFLEFASNGFLRMAIRRGRKGTPMPAFEAKLGEQAIDDVIAHLRELAKSNSMLVRPPPPARPPPIPLGPVPLHPKGPEPKGFNVYPKVTSVTVVKEELDHGAKMALLDARASSDYAREHIAGAVSVPFYDPDPYVNKLPRDAWLVCYCACPRAESGTLAQKLMAKGFEKVTVLAEGIGLWRAKGFGTATGVEPGTPIVGAQPPAPARRLHP